MVEHGVAITAARREIAGRLNKACATGISLFPRAHVFCTGELETWLKTLPALEAEDRMRQLLVKNRSADADNARTPIGPHRSDMKVRHVVKEKNAEYCSTGEQKALLVAIILADARLRTAENNTAPLILLDEIAAHLDQNRLNALFEEICSLRAQVWLTGTDRSIFDNLRPQAQFLEIEDGRVHPML